MIFQLIISLVVFTLPAQENADKIYSQWRGPQRNGIYTETGLLKSWPASGPELLWSAEGLGSGHGSIGPGRDRLFVLGLHDNRGYLYAYDFSGKLLWKKEYGSDWNENYEGSRSTPVAVGDRVYFESGTGVVYCYNAVSGEKLWSVDMYSKFGARKITWGMTESLLIDGDYLYCTPGGKEINVAALNRFTGAVIWTSKANGEPSAYCSPIMVEHGKLKMVVTITAESVIGVDAKTGSMYWRVAHMHYNKIHANSPVYDRGWIFCSSEYDRSNSGLLGFRLSDDGKSVVTQWHNEEFRNLMGGIIVTGGYIYASHYKERSWCSIDCSNGKVVFSSDKLDDGNIIMADGLFYCYTEKGEFALVKFTPASFDVISKFRIPKGTGPHWSHPVIFKGRLYIRHGDSLMVYNIKMS